jgi:hypothetical protein
MTMNTTTNAKLPPLGGNHPPLDRPVQQATRAHSEVLTAEVRVLMVGTRKLTMAMYEQLDHCPADKIEPFGRVRPRNGDWPRVYVIGRDPDSGCLVRSYIHRYGPGFARSDGVTYPAEEAKWPALKPLAPLFEALSLIVLGS